jgi:DNA-binding NarL/FixJ family response regulator
MEERMKEEVNGVISILVVDENEILRRGLVSLLGEYPEFKVVGQASNPEEALSLASQLQPDVVTIEVRMPGIGSNTLTSSIQERLPQAKTLIITSSDTEEDLFTAIRDGALGYVLKEVNLNEIVSAIRTVARGETVISPSIATRLFNELRRGYTDPCAADESDLSPRELEVLRLVAQGAPNKEIALRLFVTEATVKAHLRRILQKLRAGNRTEAAAIAHAKGLIE